MKIYLSFLLIIASLTSCIAAPDYKRDNTNDRKAGIPYIHNSSYKVDQSGLTINWIDGSLQNDVYIVEQHIFDYSSENTDSLVKISQLEEDRTFFLDSSKEFGYPYIVYIKSQILDVNSIKAEVIDTLAIEFGTLDFRSQYRSNDFVFFNWQNLPNYHYSDSLLVEKQESGNWQFVTKLAPRAQSYAIPKSSVNNGDTFRISATINNFNGKLSRTSSFEVTVE